MSFYDELADVTLELLTEYGQVITRRAVTIGAYDPATGAAATTTADTTRRGAMFDIGGSDTQPSHGGQFLRGSLVQVGDRRLLVDAEAAVNPQDRMIVGGVEYCIVSVGIVAPAGTAVLYDLHVRAA